ncbi:hypothetical protein H5410_000846 [Solanum commersonii]|uniref:Uncharacterized protein n=1 Tax=Solanum commersonii TaxID=4109 RepID=A0A9J6AXL9_SOLCO|nr:hypothetical protein H5410_000846 [Solanum commersonii]
MPPSFPTSSELNQGDQFTTFQQTQSASLTHLTQDIPLVYTFAPPKSPSCPSLTLLLVVRVLKGGGIASVKLVFQFAAQNQALIS